MQGLQRLSFSHYSHCSSCTALSLSLQGTLQGSCQPGSPLQPPIPMILNALPGIYT